MDAGGCTRGAPCDSPVTCGNSSSPFYCFNPSPLQSLKGSSEQRATGSYRDPYKRAPRPAHAAFDITLLNGRSAPGILFDGNFYTWIFGASPIARAQYDYGLTIYTNRSGLLGPSAAFGFLGGGVVLLAMAVLVSVLARRTRAGSPVALAMYCGSAVGLLEVVRLFYFGTSRFLPVLLAGIVLAITWRLASRKRAHDVQGHASATSLIAMTGVERS